MKRTALPERVQKLLSHISYATIATTCLNGQPWNTPVAAYFDDDLNLYWASDTLSQHSKNIVHNPTIFAVLYDASAPFGEGFALYVQMYAQRIVHANDVAIAMKTYLDRYGEEEPGHRPFVGKCPRRIYRAELVHIWTNTDGKRNAHFIDSREPVVATRQSV